MEYTSIEILWNWGCTCPFLWSLGDMLSFLNGAGTAPFFRTVDRIPRILSISIINCSIVHKFWLYLTLNIARIKMLFLFYSLCICRKKNRSTDSIVFVLVIYLMVNTVRQEWAINRRLTRRFTSSLSSMQGTVCAQKISRSINMIVYFISHMVELQMECCIVDFHAFRQSTTIIIKSKHPGLVPGWFWEWTLIRPTR